MGLIGLLDSGLSKILTNKQNAVPTKHNQPKHSKMRYACISSQFEKIERKIIWPFLKIKPKTIKNSYKPGK